MLDLMLKYQLMRYHQLFILIILPLVFACKKETASDDSHYSIQISKLRHGYLDARKEIFALNQTNISAYRNKAADFFNVNNQANFNSLRSKFLTARSFFMFCGPYLFGNGAISLPNSEMYGRLDSYPINMKYIDYTNTNASSGIINDATNYPNINEFSIMAWDKVGGANNSSCGMHVIEFLLWGQDLTAGSPGNRPLSDFIDLRRRQYLNFSSSLLKNDMALLQSQTTLENDLLAAEPAVAFDFMLSGFLKFIKDDFATNGIKNALESQSDADEISRFSDQTKQDLLDKLKAFRSFYDPRSLFTVSDEYFLIDFVKEIDSDLNSEIIQKLDEIESILSNLPVDFDQAIVNTQYRQSLNQVYNNLIQIHDKLNVFSQKVID